MPVTFIDVSDETEGQRLDNFLITQLKGVPKSKIYNIIRKGEVRVNKGRAKPTYRLAAGDKVRVPPIKVATRENVEVSQNLSQLLENSVVYEDKHWLVVNKPGELAVHGGSGLSLGLIEALRKLRPEEKFLELCHRIDKATSGCVVLARRRSALKVFHQCLREKKLQKHYLVMVVGRWSKANDAVNLPLQKNTLSSGERMVRVDPEGKRSVTRFNIRERLKGYTLMEAMPITGRTHQIRVHCQAMGHAIVGDKKYGNKEINKRVASEGCNGLFLHAHAIELPRVNNEGQYDPQLEKRVVESPLPGFWQAFIDAHCGS